MIVKCRKCGNDGDHSVRPNGKPTSYCKKCQREHSRQHYRTYKREANGRHRLNQGKLRLKRRAMIAKLKDKPCADCGLSYPPHVMDFDHCRGDKVFDIGHTKATDIGIKTLMAEVAKCDVVCANCHRERTHQRRLGMWAKG
jgi:hypothetical protein